MTRDILHELELRATQDFEAIRRLALASGLEDGTFQRTVVAFGYYHSDSLVGCATLRRDGETFSVDWLAVAESMRGEGLGSAIVAEVEKEASKRGAVKLWALARAPKFFEKIGFREAGKSDGAGPVLANCISCRQYHTSCFPAVMVKDL